MSCEEAPSLLPPFIWEGQPRVLLPRELALGSHITLEVNISHVHRLWH